MLDAGWLEAAQWAAYEARGKTGKRSAADPCLEALWPALDGKIPVAFEADSADEIHRALDFAAEFKLKPVIVGRPGMPGEVAQRLAAEKGAARDSSRSLDYVTATEREVDLPVRVREDRDRIRKEEIGCAAVLHKAGVKFAFTSQGAAVNRFRENVRRVIAAGLDADAALTALTSEAADILGVTPQVGRVTKGRSPLISSSVMATSSRQGRSTNGRSWTVCAST